ncbi:MAG: hypothetical protein AAGF77_01880 [Bacteroidota bacterium]
MKIRIKGNSVRLRLTKTEVAQFCETGRYEEQTHFGTTTLRYVLLAKANTTVISADYKDNTITICLPDAVQDHWATSDRIGYQNEVDWNDPSALSVLVEKDFTCLDATIEDQSDNYPNPRLL